MPYPRIFASLFCVLILASCGKTPPKQEEVTQRITGNYCAEGYRLELRPDSTFFNMRVKPGTLGSKPQVDRCSGIYSLELNESTGEWAIVFKKSKAFSVAICEGRVAIWNKENGWIGGDSAVTINEWFDKTLLEKGKCEI